MRAPTVLLLLATTLACATARADDDDATNACAATAREALRSCQRGAESDYWLALGRCVNLADSTQRRSCVQQARPDLRDARAQCLAQHSVRVGACPRLGEQPYDPVIDPKNFVAKVDNPYFPLAPGTNFVYEGATSSGLVHVEFMVTRNTREILGVTTTEVHDVVTTNGEVTEDTLDWFAQDRQGNVWYFGESTEELSGGRPTTLSGTFTAGESGAKAGIIMRAHPTVGNFYRQEFDLDNAEDFADVTDLNATVSVPAGTYTHCLVTLETTPLEPDLHEAKWYAPGVGNILTKDLNTGETIALLRIENK